jgi:peptidoglycan/xylan/chitin deacetylase (PgdA/CDA1 family)
LVFETPDIRELVIVTGKLLLNFHGVGRPHTGVTEAEHHYWLAMDRFIDWIEISDSVAREFALTIVLTFDDGNISDLEIVAPLLAKYDVRGLFFPCVGRTCHKHYLDKSGLRTLAQMGHEIGSHGVNHVPWTSLDPKALHREIHDSKQCLENILDAKVDSVAIPFGAYNRRVLLALQNAAFSRIYTTDQGIVTGSPMIINRYSVRRDDDPEHLRKIIERLRSRQFRLISNLKTMIKSLR